MSEILNLSNVIKRFPISGSRNSVQAVNDVSFKLHAGQTLGLVGESGSGKTTVGRIIVGLLELTGGQIRFEDQDLESLRRIDHRALLGHIQIVFQEPAEQLDPRLTVADSVGEPLLPFKLDPAERKRRVNEALKLVSLPESVGEAHPTQLSGGQQQRVGIARAMITKPKMVVLDEPTSALDPSARAELIDLLMKIQRESGTAYLFISHDLSTVRFISDRVAVMYLGMVVEEGPTASVFAHPRHPYSQALLGSALLPNPNIRPDTNVNLSGEIPSPINLPNGCFLASRCPFAIERCRTEIPPREAVAQDHFVRCIRHAEVGDNGAGNDLYEQFQAETERILSVGAPTRRAASGAFPSDPVPRAT